MEINLCPAQQTTFELLINSTARGNIVTVWGRRGLGKTTVLRQAEQKLGGAFLNMDSFLEAFSKHDPNALEEAFFKQVRAAIEEHEVVLLDDCHWLRATLCE